jgi:group I intron endonuclease
MIGIYRIKNIVNGKSYYGSSINIEKRWKRHKNDLIKNRHINTLLQRAWNKYTEINFIFEVIEECDKNILLEREQYYLDLNQGYNIGIKSSGGDNITKNPNKKEIVNRIAKSIKERYDLMSDEEKKQKHSQPMETNPNWKGGASFKYCECGVKITPINNSCINCRDKTGVNNPFFGKKHSEETKKKLSEKRKGKKPTNMKQIIIDNTIYESLAEASRQTGIPSPTILWRIKSKSKKYENYQSHPSIKAPLSN